MVEVGSQVHLGSGEVSLSLPKGPGFYPTPAPSFISLEILDFLPAFIGSGWDLDHQGKVIPASKTIAFLFPIKTC